MKKLFILIVSIILALSTTFTLSSCKKRKDTSLNSSTTSEENSLESVESESESIIESEEEKVSFESLPGFVAVSNGGADITIGELINAYKENSDNTSYKIHLEFDITGIVGLFSNTSVLSIIYADIQGNFDTPTACDLTIEIKTKKVGEEAIVKGQNYLIRDFGIFRAEYTVVDNEKVYDHEDYIWEPQYFDFISVNEMRLSDIIALATERIPELKESIDVSSYINRTYDFFNTEMFNSILTTDPETGVNYLSIEFDFAEEVNSLLTRIASLKNIKVSDLIGEQYESIKAYLLEDPTVISILDDLVATMKIEGINSFEDLTNILQEKIPYSQLIQDLQTIGILNEEMYDYFSKFNSYYELAIAQLYYIDETAELPMKFYTISEFLEKYNINLNEIISAADVLMNCTVEGAINLLETLDGEEHDPGLGTNIFLIIENLEFQTIDLKFYAELSDSYLYTTFNSELLVAVTDQETEKPFYFDVPFAVITNINVYTDEYEYIIPAYEDTTDMELGRLVIDTYQCSITTDAELENINSFLHTEYEDYNEALAALEEYFRSNCNEIHRYPTYIFSVYYNDKFKICCLNDYDYDYQNNKTIYIQVDFEYYDGELLSVGDWAVEGYDAENEVYLVSKEIQLSKSSKNITVKMICQTYTMDKLPLPKEVDIKD